MAYVSEEQRKSLRILRDMIDYELNNIAVTDDVTEIDNLITDLRKDIENYAKLNRDRINGIYER